ncbi:MAG: DUF4350 domain-containing protein [Lewinellaceae bacterium]|nr:DUF4350 domain-containing protein [Lewinellaceae bacterium]
MGAMLPLGTWYRPTVIKWRQISSEFTPAGLAQCDILVIANALDSASNTRWVLPNRSAFSPAEIAAVQNWVRQGGSLFLIADHMPFAGSAADLAAAFGVRMLNCFAMDNRRRVPEKFFRAEKPCSIAHLLRVLIPL